MKRQVRITSLPKKELPKANSGLYTKEKLTNNAFQFPVTFREGMKPGFEVKKRLGPVDRDAANIEAEKNETIITPMGDDAWTKSLPKTYVIGGKKHSKGGTPLNVPEGSFIYSDHLKEKNQKIHEMLGKAAKKSGYTYADLSKPYMLNDDIRLLIDPDSDKITKDTAQQNIQNKVDKLGMIALLQEAQKGFTDDKGETDIPSVGIPYADKAGIELDKAMDPFMEAIKQPQNQMAQGMQVQEDQDLNQMQAGKYGGLVRMKQGGSVKKYEGGGTASLGKDEKVVYNSTSKRYEILDAQNKVVGIISAAGQSLKITRDKIPSNAVIIDRASYKTDEDFQFARTEAYKNSNGVPVVVKNGSTYKLLSQKNKVPTYTGEDLGTLFAGDSRIASKYQFVQAQFNNPKIKAELSKRAIAALDNAANRSTSLTASEITALKKKLEDPEYAYKMFMDMQKRNFATFAHEQKGNLSKRIYEHGDAADVGKVTNKDFEDSWTKVGVSTPTDEEAKLQQALYIGYKDLIQDKKDNKLDTELTGLVKDFDIAQVGATDKADIAGTGKGKISKIDGKYTNTTTGEIVWLGDEKELTEGDLAPGETQMTPFKKPEYIQSDPVKGWTAPDIRNYWGAVNEVYNDQPQEPYIAMPNTYLPGVAVMSPEDMQQQIRGERKSVQDTLQSYSGRGSTAAVLSGMQGAEQIASQTAQVHNANIGIINNFEQNKAATLNQASTNAANLTTTLWDRWAQLKDNMQARKSAAKAEVRKAFAQGETNEANYQAINLNNPNYQWDPFTQDFAGFIPGANINPTYNNKTTAADLFKQYKNQMPGVSDAAIAQLVKTDMGVPSDTPDYLNYSSGINS
jgi:hypothetical protein